MFLIMLRYWLKWLPMVIAHYAELEQHRREKALYTNTGIIGTMDSKIIILLYCIDELKRNVKW